MKKILYISHVSLKKSHYGAASSGRAHEQVFQNDPLRLEYLEQFLDGNLFRKKSYKSSAMPLSLPVAQIYLGNNNKHNDNFQNKAYHTLIIDKILIKNRYINKIT